MVWPIKRKRRITYTKVASKTFIAKYTSFDIIYSPHHINVSFFLVKAFSKYTLLITNAFATHNIHLECDERMRCDYYIPYGIYIE